MINSTILLQLMLIFVAIFLLHDFYLYKTSPIYIYEEKDPQFKLLNPHSEILNHRFNINYSRLVDIDFKFIVNPKICSDQLFLLIIVVSSDLFNIKDRMAIRQTWGRTNNAIKTIFTIGVRNNKELSNKIAAESKLYGDIVQGDFIDAYRNLTYKHMMGLKWVTHHCPTARYILKTDDDVFVNYSELMKFLVRELSPWGAQSLIACMAWDNMSVLRTNDTKWYVSKDEFEPDEYPRYCSGSFILYSQDVLPFLIEASQTTKYLFVDDAFVTGIVATKAGIPRTNIGHLFLNREGYKILMQKGLKGVQPFLFGPLNIEAEHIRHMWNKMPEARTH